MSCAGSGGRDGNKEPACLDLIKARKGIFRLWSCHPQGQASWRKHEGHAQAWNRSNVLKGTSASSRAAVARARHLPEQSMEASTPSSLLATPCPGPICGAGDKRARISSAPAPTHRKRRSDSRSRSRR